MPNPTKVQLTILNSMAGRDFAQCLRRHVAWGIRLLDLKDCIFGKSITELTDEETLQVRRMIDQYGMGVTNLSTGLFHGQVEKGEAFFAENYLAKAPRVIAIAKVLQPRCIRLLAAQSARRAELSDSTEYLHTHHPWVIPMYGRAIDEIHAAGFRTLIENEVGGCIWSRPAEVLSFFAELGRAEKVRFMWDIQNLWQMGTFPSLEAYRQLKPLIAQVHLKGGQSETPGGALKWSSSLADASWPVLEVVRRVVADAVSPVICLNPSHGQAKSGYDYSDVTKRDLDFLRRNIPEIE